MTEKDKILAIASDHGGYEMKEFIREKLTQNGCQVKDYGTYSDKSVDYPDFIHPLSKAVNDGDFERAVIICGSGNGAQMTANKYSNVRAALCWDEEITSLSRKHNDANIISLPGRFLRFEKAYLMVQVFLNAEFEGGRHERRVTKISEVIK